LEAGQKPEAVKLWQAHNDSTRDFRIDVLGPKWTATDLPIREDGVYEVNMTTPARGWTGYFVEITYPGKIPFKVTTGVEVLPRTYPFEPYVSATPRGTMQ
jgi:PhoPQ-activated pathogenicity-related protein